MADVFISYKREERGEVERIAERLRGLGLEIWFDTKLPSGQSFDEEINREVRAAKCVLVCWSPGAMASDWVRAEASIGRGRDVLAAVMLKPTDLYPPFNLVHAEDLTDWGGEDLHPGWLNTLARIGELTSRPDIVQRARRYGAVSGAKGGAAAPAKAKQGGGALIAVLALVSLAVGAAGFWFVLRGSGPESAQGAGLGSTVTVDADSAATPPAAAEPAPAPVEPGPAPQGFRVVEVLASADPREFTGECPKAVRFSARISVLGGAGTVSYRWLRNDGALAPIETVRFEQSGSQTVATTWTLGANGDARFNPYNGWQAIEILEPAPLRSENATFALRCEAAPPTPRPRPGLVRPDVVLSAPRLPTLAVPREGRVSLRQTYLLDFDRPVEQRDGADLWYNARTATDRALVARGGQTALMRGGARPSYNQCATANFGTGDSLDLARDVGRWMCVKTGEGRIGAVSVMAAPGPSPSPVELRYVLWN